MHDERSTPDESLHNGGDDLPTTTEEDAIIERRVLHTVLDAYPELSSRDELVREIADDPEDFGQRDAVMRAVRDLTGIGLLHCPGGVVMPSRAALRFDSLNDNLR